jgi:hypothetical protein
MLAQGDALMGEAVAKAVKKGGAFAHYKKYFLEVQKDSMSPWRRNKIQISKV